MTKTILPKPYKFLDKALEFLETEASSSKSQSIIVSKLFSTFKIVILTALLIPIDLSIIQGNSLQDLFLKIILLLAIPVIRLLRFQWLKLPNSVFVLVFWLSCLQLPKRLLDSYEEENRITLLFVGYIIGIFEAMMTFSIKKFHYRVALQMILISTKLFKFSEFLNDELTLIVSLCFLGLLSVFFFPDNISLERRNSKTAHDSQTNLKNFHAYLEDDFPISILIVNLKLENIFYSNRCFRKTFNFQEENLSPSVLKSCFQNFIIESDERTKESIMVKNLLNFIQAKPKNEFNKTESTSIYAFYKPDGEIKDYYEVKIHEILWEKEPAFAIILNSTRANQQLIALKLAEEQKDRMLSTISHELKTPINGIVGLLDIVRSQIKDEKLITYLEHCHGCSKLLLYFVNSLLDLNLLKQGNLKLEKQFFNLDDVLNEIKSLFTFTGMQKGVEIYLEKEKQLPQNIYTDKRRLTEILIQLMGNAVKFTFKGFVRLRVSLAQSDTAIIFSVDDTGVGIKEENKTGLFSNFGSLSHPKTNINQHGVGIGLTIANDLVKTLNDTKDKQQLFMESKDNIGSKFWFSIDAKPGSVQELPPDLTDPYIFEENTKYEAQTESTVLGSVGEAVTRNILSHRTDLKVTSLGHQTSMTDSSDAQSIYKNILIVDDNPFNLLAASHMVKKVGCVPFTADSGEECLNMLKKSKFSEHKFSLILMDIQMPLMDGVETTRLINKDIENGTLYPVSIAALTAKMINSEERKKYKELGMCEALEKPLIESKLRKILRDFQI